MSSSSKVPLTDEQIEKLRQSGVALRDGRFWHEGAEVMHHGLRAAFWRWLDRNPDGRYVLRLDEKRFVYLEVEGEPYVVRSLRWDGPTPIARLSDDSEEPLDAPSLRIDGSEVRCTVKGGRFAARVSSAAWGALQERIEERDGRPVLLVGNEAHTLD